MEKIRIKKDEESIQKIKKLQFRIPTLISREEAKAEELKKRYRPISAEENAKRNKFEGSIYYAAPEQFEPTNVLTQKCDVYQLGAVMFTMFTGQRPINGSTLEELVDAAMNPNKPKITQLIPSSALLEELANLIAEMVAFDEDDRIDIDEVRERMDRILFSHAMELKKEPSYVMPPEYQHPDDVAWWNNAVLFAKKMHSGCMETVFDSILNG